MTKTYTFVMVKPDATERGLVGSILGRFESHGMRVEALDFRHLKRAEAEFLYAEHVARAHFDDLCKYTVSGPVALAALSQTGEDASTAARLLIGAADPQKRADGTLRAELALDQRRNAVHGSDGPEAAARELDHFFPQLRRGG